MADAVQIPDEAEVRARWGNFAFSKAWDAKAKAYLPGHKTEAVHIAGAGRGLWGIAAALEDGAKAGADALRRHLHSVIPQDLGRHGHDCRLGPDPDSGNTRRSAMTGA